MSVVNRKVLVIFKRHIFLLFLFLNIWWALTTMVLVVSGSAYGLLPSFSVKTQRSSLNHSLQTPSSLYRSLQRQVSFRLFKFFNDCSMWLHIVPQNPLVSRTICKKWNKTGLLCVSWRLPWNEAGAMAYPALPWKMRGLLTEEGSVNAQWSYHQESFQVQEN